MIITVLEHVLVPIRTQTEHVATPKGQHCDESYHIAQLLRGGELSVGAVAAAAHGPGDEGSRRPRPEDGRGEAGALTERALAHIAQRVRECDGGETSASTKSSGAKTCQRVGECE